MSTTENDVKQHQRKSKGSRSEKTGDIPKNVLGIYGASLIQAKASMPSVINIKVQPAKIDRLATKALKRLKEQLYDECHLDEKVLLKNISNKGWTGYIKNVTDRLNRIGLGHASSHVLASTYAYTLNEILFQNDDRAGKNSHTDQSVSDEKVKDTVGLAQEVMFKQEEENGPLAMFAAQLAEIVLEKKNITLSDAKKTILVNQLRVQF